MHAGAQSRNARRTGFAGRTNKPPYIPQSLAGAHRRTPARRPDRLPEAGPCLAGAASSGAWHAPGQQEDLERVEGGERRKEAREARVKAQT